MTFQPETIAVQGTYSPKSGEPRVLPLYQSTTYAYENTDEVAALFDLAAPGHLYSRISNPTVAIFEEKIAALEKGVAAVATASGMAAILNTVLNVASTGDNILSSTTIYGGTYNLFSTTLKKFGITTRFFDQDASTEDIIQLADEKTKLLFLETVSNPGLIVLDFEKFSHISETLEIPFVVDNSLVSPSLCRPLEHGAHIVVHSSSKYIEGHATAVGGLIVDGGNFNWENGKFPEFTTPDESYHGVSYVKDFGQAAFATKARVQLVRDLGNIQSPFNAYISNLGAETLALRTRQHSENALKIAKWLQTRSEVSFVKYPGLESDSQHTLAQKYLPDGASGMVTFGIKGGEEPARKFIDHLELVQLVVHCADVRSCILHPASSTHRQMSDAQLEEGGVTRDLVRFSVGIENADDLITDLEKGFASIN